MQALMDKQVTANPPLIWLLLGHKAGDNNQVLSLAESLGLPFDSKPMRYRSTELLSNLLLGPNLLGIDSESQRQLTAPWPRMVITAGRRNEPVARWIQRQAPHDVRLVHIGRPWARPDRFDLIVTTPQYQLGDAANVIRLDLPLRRCGSSIGSGEVDSWRERFSQLSKPRIAVLVGGESGKFYLSVKRSTRLGVMAGELARQLGGSLLITTSARSPANAGRIVADASDVPHFLHVWQPHATENPYRAYLEIADGFVVTGDSMSMLAEACETQKPVYIFDMEDDAGSVGGIGNALEKLRYKAWTHNLAQRLAPVRMRRDVSLLHEALIESGRAVTLGEKFGDRRPPPLPSSEEATRRTLTLIEDR